MRVAVTVSDHDTRVFKGPPLRSLGGVCDILGRHGIGTSNKQNYHTLRKYVYPFTVY